MWSGPGPSCHKRAPLPRADLRRAMKKELLDSSTLENITARAVSEIIVESEFVALLQEGKPLRLKMGFDPSRSDIHLGHVVGLRKLRQLQELGHEVILIVGDWTAQIGDPSGQSATRPMLSHEEVVANAESYMQQFFRVVDRSRTRAMWQSEWFGKFTLADVIRLTRRFTVAQFLDRDDFNQRFKAHRPIAITELLYPLLQAYDSVVIEADVEFGGTDQMFNLLVGRELQGMMGQRPQQCFMMPILVGTDGVQKMSKSLDNYISLDDAPADMYGKVMSLPDGLTVQYFEYLTDVPSGELQEMRRVLDDGSGNPMDLKKRLARDIVGQFHSPAETVQAEEHFERVYQRREAPETVEEYPLSISGSGKRSNILDVLVDTSAVRSRSEAKRLIGEGAVEVDGQRVTSQNVDLSVGSLMKVGRRGRRFIKITDSDTGGYVDRPRQNLRTPGPTPCPLQVMEAMAWPMINHRGPEFRELILGVTEKLKRVFMTENRMYILTASGTGSMEASIVNTLSPGDKVLSVSVGYFGDRFADIARGYGAQVTKLDFPMGTAADPDAIRAALRDDPEIAAVLVTHNETSTGVTNDLAAIAGVVKGEFDRLLLVDAISSMGCIPLPADDWHCDVVCTASQKGLMVPPGLSFVSLSDTAWDARERAKMPRSYFDLEAAQRYLDRGQNPWTPAVSLFYGLDVALGMLLEEGMEAVFRRHVNVAEMTRQGVRDLGLDLLVDGPHASNTVTAVKLPDGVDGGKLSELMRTEHSVVLAGGQGPLQGKIFRIGHMGQVSEEDIQEVLVALEVTLPKVGYRPARTAAG